MKVKVNVVFETYRPIDQEVGKQMWGGATTSFRRESGSATYRLQGRCTVVDMTDAVVSMQEHVIGTIAAFYPHWPSSPSFLEIGVAKEHDSVTREGELANT